MGPAKGNFKKPNQICLVRMRVNSLLMEEKYHVNQKVKQEGTASDRRVSFAPNVSLRQRHLSLVGLQPLGHAILQIMVTSSLWLCLPWKLDSKSEGYLYTSYQFQK